jgi:hypothetical protein
MTYSGAGRLRYIEAVFQHLEARHDIARDCQDDRELSRGDLVGRLDPGLQRADYRCAAVACEDVIDFEGNGRRQRADIADEIDDRLATGLAADPREDAIIALDLEYEIDVEQGGNLGRVPTTADAFQKLPCDSDVLLMVGHLSP